MEAKSIVSEKEYFGPIFWNFIHTACLANEEYLDSDLMESFLGMIWELIPCGECQEHFQDMIKENPYTEDRYAKGASLYVNHLHNLVNVRLGKKEVSYEEFILSIEDDNG